MAEPVRITNSISSCEVVTSSSKQDPKPSETAVFRRNQVLDGSTYKIKPPDSDHAVYVTINHAVMDNKPRLMEIFINSKNMEHFAWVVALTRVISAIFRHEVRPTFLVEELRSVFDPRGGYWTGGKYIPSLVAEIGNCLQQHMERLGIVEQGSPPPLAKPEKKNSKGIKPQELCEKCGAFAVVYSGGCDKCHECGFSKRCGDA